MQNQVILSILLFMGFNLILNAQVTITPNSLGINKFPTTTLDVAGDARINDNQLYLRGGIDVNHGLGWFGTYDNTSIDGSVVYGFKGGGLGSTIGGSRLIFQWQESGEVSIKDGTTQNRLQIGEGASKLSIGPSTGADLNFGTSYIGFNSSRVSNNWLFNGDGSNNGGAVIYNNIGGDINFSTTSSTGGTDQTLTDSDILQNIRMAIKFDGRVGIGTGGNPLPLTLGTNNLSDYKLYVCGGILSNEWLVPNITWCDYVFEEDYDLKPLAEVEQHIEENGYLHNTPSAEEIETNGLEMAKITINQQEKIEELFLHMIEMDKRVKVLEEKNKQLEKENAELKVALNQD